MGDEKDEGGVRKDRGFLFFTVWAGWDDWITLLHFY